MACAWLKSAVICDILVNRVGVRQNTDKFLSNIILSLIIQSEIIMGYCFKTTFTSQHLESNSSQAVI